MNVDTLVILSDREVLTRTLLEVETLLESPRSTTYLRLSFQARARVLWLLRCLCSDHLTPHQLSSIQDRSTCLQACLKLDQSPGQDLSPLLELSLVQARGLR